MGYAYTTFVIIVAVAIKGVIAAWWGRFKARKALEPTPMKLNRQGVYVPWGIVQRVERGLNITLVIWLVWIAMMIGIGLRYKFVLHKQPDLVTILSGGLL